jgi:hypothetical protein
MKKKTPKLLHFIEGLHEFIEMRSHLLNKAVISSKFGFQDIIAKLISEYLEDYFLKDGYKNVITKASEALNWEGKESEDDDLQSPVFGEITYPDFVIDDPYLIAVVYKEGDNVYELKQGIAESLIYTLSGDFDFAYFLFHDKTQDKKIARSVDYKLESFIVAEMWDHHNVCIKII